MWEKLVTDAKFLSINLDGKDNLEDAGVLKRTILKWILNKQGVTVRT